MENIFFIINFGDFYKKINSIIKEKAGRIMSFMLCSKKTLLNRLAGLLSLFLISSCEVLGPVCQDPRMEIVIQESMVSQPAPFEFNFIPAPDCVDLGPIWMLETQVSADVGLDNPICFEGRFSGREIIIEDLQVSNGRFSTEFEFRPNAFPINEAIKPHCLAGRLAIDAMGPDIRFNVRGNIRLAVQRERWGARESSEFYSIAESNLELEQLNISGMDPIDFAVRDLIATFILDRIDLEVSRALNEFLCFCEQDPPINEVGFPLYVDGYDPR